MGIENEQYQNRIATVVGGRGQLGRRIVKGFKDLGFGQVRICEQSDPFTEIVDGSDTIFFATDSKLIIDMLRTARTLGLIQPGQNILDGASVKRPLFPIYYALDHEGVSVCSTHFGAVPNQPPRGIKVWLCEVGPNSEEAKRVALDLYVARDASIQVIKLKEHPKIEEAQWVTMAMGHFLAGTLRRLGFPLEEFDHSATLNSELAGLSLGRTLGQGTKVPAEILSTQPRRRRLMAAMHETLQELEESLLNGRGLTELMNANIEYHGGLHGDIERIFRKAGIVGARNANLRMYSMGIRVTDDEPGKLIKLLSPFYEEGVNLTALDTMSGIITPEEEQQGVDPDRIVDFDLGIDLKTMDKEKEWRIKEKLWALGCSISYSGHKLNR